MQVRKYEADTMKEAVEKVKGDLGPEAIILSTRTQERGVSRIDGRSVVVTAAVSEETYNKKTMVEKRLTDREREKLIKKPARQQKKFIEQVYENINEKIEVKRQGISKIPYAMIDEEPTRKEQKASYPVEEVTAHNITNEQSPKNYDLEIKKIDELKSEILKLKKIVEAEKSKKTESPVTKQNLDKTVAQKMFDYLTDLGVDRIFAKVIIDKAKRSLGRDIDSKTKLDSWIAKFVIKSVKVSSNPLKEKYHFFVGPQGSGKTSSLVKMAGHMVIKHKKRVAIVTTDTSKIGSVEQMRIYAKILNVPLGVVSANQSIESLLNDFSGYDHILIDTSGSSLMNSSDVDSYKKSIPLGLKSKSVHLVLSSLTRENAFYSVAKRFESMGINDFIITNTDQVSQHGFLLNLSLKSERPLYAMSDGPKVPENFEWFSKEQVLDLIFKITKSN